jgi:superfamily I DNA/RNA helicase
VDEYQDLNKAEQATLDLLSDQAHVCIVGDDDQSIYSFKHAHPEGIREWVEIHPDTDDLSLAECRRCPTRVAKMANSLISHNQLRPVPRALVPREENGEGDIRIIQFQSLNDEINGVVDTVEELIDRGNRPGDILILAQRGAIGTPIYELLIERGIRVTSYYAESDLNTEEAQRKLSLLKLLVDRDDRVALRWLLGLGSKNWRSSSYSRIRDYCSEEGISPWEVLTRLSDGALMLPYTSPLVARFDEIRGQLDALEQCTDIATLVDELFPSGEEATRDIRDTALSVLAELDSADRREFLSELTRAITAPEVPSEVEEVRVMSLHKSKGLSAPITIIAGCVEGLLPMRPDPSLSPEERSAYMEEQRRLFYVGVSRVKATPSQGQPGTLILTYSQRMPLATAMSAGIAPATSRYGTATLHASRFIAELGPSAPAPVAG